MGFLRGWAATFGFLDRGVGGTVVSTCLSEEVGRLGAPSLEEDLASRWMEGLGTVAGTDEAAELERVVRLGAGRAGRRSDMSPGTEGEGGRLVSGCHWRMVAGGTRGALSCAPIHLPVCDRYCGRSSNRRAPFFFFFSFSFPRAQCDTPTRRVSTEEP